MSSKPPKPNQNSNSTQFLQPLLNYPSLYMNSDDLHLPSTHAAAEPDNTFYRRNSHGKGFELDEHAGAFTLAKLGAAASDHVASHEEQGRSGIGFTERFKRWSFENERGGGTVQGNNMHSYSMSPLLEIAGAQNDHSLLGSAAAGAGAAGGGRAGGGGGSEIREGGHGNLVQGSLGSSVGESINVGYLPLSNLEAEFANTKPQYSTQDMEILSVTQGHNPSSGSVQQQQQQLYEQQIPSSLTPHNLASYLNFATHRSPTSYPTNDHLRLQHNQHLQLLGDHHQWGPGLHTSSSASHPHAELLLLPGVAESVVDASPTSPHTAAFSSSKLDLLHGSSLHDKQAHMLGAGAVAGGGGRMPATTQMWHIDKLDMAVGLGLRDHSARSSMFAQDVDHFASTRQAQSGLSLFLQSPQERAQTGLSLDAVRYSSRSPSGSLGVLRNSKYLKAAQQLLNEFCNVCRDAIPDVKSSIAAASISQHIWNATGVAAADENIAGNRSFLSSTEKDMNLYSSHADHYKLGSSIDHCSSQHLKLSDDHDHHQQEQPLADHDSAGSPPCASLDHPPPPPPPHKQLPADERCHLQMRKARLIAMVEELDRRYQQYRDQMQLIVTSFESATGMGAAAAYTTLWRKGMSRQFRGLRDAIGEHIRKVCRLLGEEVSSVPILSRGETPRLRLVDQRLRHQRSLQQIGMLPQQQAWRPQRGLPERSVSVLRAWLFEHFLHPYPKDSEKSMLARLTGLSRNQVSNWFINARVRLWKPMIEEMYVEESKALELSEAEVSTAGEVTRSAAAAEGGSISSDHSSRESWQTAAAAPAPAAAHYASASANLYDTRQHRSDDFSDFIHFHGGASRANDPHIAAATDMQGHADVSSQAQYSWMKNMQVQAQAQAQAAGDIGVLTHSGHHDHMSLQAAALMAQGQLNASSSFMKNGVSLTLGLQQPPPHSSYNSSNSAYARPSEALLF